MSNPHARRLRRGHLEVEDASQGKLGPEFQNAGCLLISEVRLLLERTKQQREPHARDPSSTPVYQKTSEYIEMFSRYKEASTIREIRSSLGAHAEKPQEELPEGEAESSSLQLTPFEQAQLANLAIVEVDEAKTLIPTLAMKDETQLENLLQELSSLRKFQS